MPGAFEDDDSGDVQLLKVMSVKFSKAISCVDQVEAFELIKKLSNYLEDSSATLQNFPDFDTLYKAAEQSQENLIAEMEGIADSTPGVDIINPGPKTKARASAKIDSDYLGDFNMIKDIVRAAFITNKDNDFKSILKIYKKCK